MKQFLDRDFLLETESARRLYFDIADAGNIPIIDYHCHLSPREIAENKKYSNITEAWLYFDHYKWRAMRFCGCDERYITGNASDFEKFREYCRIMPGLIGNPLYHWSHIELRRYFDCELVICEENCEKIWMLTAEKLADESMSPQSLISRSGLRLLCTTDDPADSLEYHKMIADSDFGTKVLPAFRPDKCMNIERPGIRKYIYSLGEANGVNITDLKTLEKALINSLERFEALGCRTADHGMDNYVDFEYPDPYHADLIFRKALESDGRGITANELALFKSQMMRFFAKEYNRRGFVMQLHYGVLRNPNTHMFNALGADAGFDTIYGKNCTYKLACLLDYLEREVGLPKTVIYSVNPSENAAVAALCGSFCRGDGSGMPTVTQGSAWWFNDNADGIKAQLRSYANLAPLGGFIGMLTDSRSLLSYPRHEYFRRILCSVIGELVENGLYPDDSATLKKLIDDICYNNTNRYFGFGLEEIR